MKFDTQAGKNIEQVGDIQNNNVSIDVKNIDFIVTILSTSLYSNPIESFIRETVSNAWDSHVEAGVDEPVILELGKDTEGNEFCRIQDFGVGLSPERFNDVYRNIGSSTKRSDNSQIGGFGIGRFSALAYSEMVNITTVYNGKKYLYLMYKDGNTVSIDMLHEQDTDERNGLEVKVPIKYGDFDNFTKAIKSQLVYFENLYVIDSSKANIDNLLEGTDSIEKEYNNFLIKKYNNFWVNSLDGKKQLNLVLGKVRYPIRLENLDKQYPNKIREYPISLKFEIGDLEVTPNREEILYSTDNIKTIEGKLDLALEEIDDLIMQEKSKDYTKFSEYLDALENTQYLTLLKKDEKEVKLKLSDSKKNLTLNGKAFDGKNFLVIYKTMMGHNLINCQYSFRNGMIKYNNSSMSIKMIKNQFDRVYLADLGNVKNITKRYIRETFEDGSYFAKVDNIPLKDFIKKSMRHVKETSEQNEQYYNRGYNRERFTYDHEAFKVICKHILKNVSKLQTFSDSKVPNKWIADTKAADKARRGTIKKQGFDWKQNINVHELRMKDYGGGVMTDSTPHQMEGLHKKFGKLCIYAEKGDEKLRTLYKYLKSNVMPKMVEVAPTKVKLLEKIENFVKIEDFMSTDYKLFRNIATVEYLKREMPFLQEVAKITNLSLVSERIATVIYELDEFMHKYESAASRHADTKEEKALINEIYEIAEDKGYFNEEIKSLFVKHKKELLNSQVFLEFVRSENQTLRHSTKIPENRVNLVVDYILARKLIRPSVKSVYKMKKETIFNIIPEENESN